MAKKLVYNYTFDASAKTIKVHGLHKLRVFQLITNTTDNVIIYNFADSAKGGSTSYDSENDETTLLLDHDTTSMSDSDELQIFVDQQENKIDASESLLDPVHKFRVSNPENLIDTDFEYGLQPTKWETVELVNNIPSVYTRPPGVSIGGISQVSTIVNTDTVTVTCSIDHDLSVGDPIEVQGTSSRTVNGKYIITAVPSSLTFLYRASAPQSATGNVKTAYTTIIPGSFFSGSEIDYDLNEGLHTDDATPSTLTITTNNSHGLSTSTSLYITNTVGKKSISIAQTGATAPDGDPYVDITENSIYSATHGLYNNQTVFFSVTGSGILPTTSSGAEEPSTALESTQTIYDAVVKAANTLFDSSYNCRLYMDYGNNSVNAYYVTGAEQITPEGSSNPQIQRLVYGDLGTAYYRVYNSSSIQGAAYEWSLSGEGNTDLYTGNVIDVGQYYARVSQNTNYGTFPTTLLGKGLHFCATPYVDRSYTNYIITVTSFPDPGSISASMVKAYCFDSRYAYKRTGYDRYFYWRRTWGSDNTWNTRGDWRYTYSYMQNYNYRQTDTNYLKLDIYLTNSNWNGYRTDNPSISNYESFRRYLVYMQSTISSTNMGSHYHIEVLFGKLETQSNFNIMSGYSSYQDLVEVVVDQIIADTSGVPLSVGINTVKTQVVNEDRIKLRDTNGNLYKFDDTGKAPFLIETAQTSGVVDDYYTVTGFTTTTVSIAASTRLASRELTFLNTDVEESVDSAGNEYYVKIASGHGISNGQKIVFDEVSGASIPGITSGTTYYTIAINDKYLQLADSEENWLSSINEISGAQASSGSYKLTVPSISGRVAAAGTITTTLDSKVVTGQDTRFTSTYAPGDDFVVVGLDTYSGYISNKVVSVVSDTSLTLDNEVGIATTGASHFIDTKLNVRADGTFIHRPFDGGVDITAGSSPNSKIIRQTRKYFRYQSGKGIQCSMAINFNPYRPARLVTANGTGTQKTVTVTTEYPHGLSVGNQIKFRGSSDAGYNGTFTITSSTTFTFQYTTGTIVGVTTTSPTGFMEYTINTYENAAIRAGLFDDQNGFFFEYDGSDLYAVRRSSTQQLSGTAIVANNSNLVIGTNTRFFDQLDVGDYIVIRGQSYIITEITGQDQLVIQPKYRGTSNNGVIITKTIDTRNAQSNWNIDKADGSGPSGYILDINSIQMAYMDYSWYGAGKIRFGFKDTYGHVKYMHEFIHNNRLNEAYMRTGNVPARYEVTNTSSQQPTFIPSLFHWGTSVIMDGGFDNDDSYLFTASGNTLTFTNGDSNSATTTANGFIYRQRIYGSYSRWYLGLTFNSSDADKFSEGVSLYTDDGELNGQAVDFTRISGSSLIVYIFLTESFNQPQVFPTVTSGTSVSIGAPASGETNTDVDLSSLIPLISIRLAPSADNNLIGELGERDIINRMQLKMQEMGISVSHDSRINVILNGQLSNLEYQNVGSPSLSQYVAHASGDTVQGGTTIYQFRASGGAIAGIGTQSTEVRSVNSQTFNLSPLIDLGNSILGGDGVFPNGPDIVTIAASVLDTASINANSSYTVSSRISWAESQA
tara:strand:- start:4 stop:4671 length:4668 start_codon:yes stop_codon:yes gene_type:complete